jgi:histone H3/H4
MQSSKDSKQKGIIVDPTEEEDAVSTSIYVERNLRNIRHPCGVQRAAAGVSQSIQKHDVEPILRNIIDTACRSAFDEGRKTVKHKHAIEALNKLGLTDIANFQFEQLSTPEEQ